MTNHLTNEQRRLVRLRYRGLSTAAIARDLGLTWEGGAVVLRSQKRVARANDWTSAKDRLSVQEHEEILLEFHRGLSMRSMAQEFGRAPSTVTREVKAIGGRGNYRF